MAPTTAPVPKDRCLPNPMGCLIIFVIMVIAAGILLFAVYANSSHPKLPSFGVESASLNSLTLNNSRLSGEWNINLTFTNPNNGWNEASYDTISVSILYNNEHNNRSLLASSQLAPFSEKDDGTVLKQVQLKMDLHDADIEHSFSIGTVNFGIEMSTVVRFTGAFDFRKDYSLKVVCNPLTIRLSPGSSKWDLAQGLACESTTC